jgi:hypothetical protein
MAAWTAVFIENPTRRGFFGISCAQRAHARRRLAGAVDFGRPGR